VARDGRITFINPQAEMGQGIWSSLAMVFIDEFGGDWERTDIEAGGVRPEFRINPYVHEVFTAGSSSIANGYVPVRRAAAAAREMFLAAGAARLGVPASSLSLVDSYVVAESGERLGIGELIDDVVEQSPPADATVKSDDALKYVGKGVAAKEIPAKVTGRAVYGIDFALPGMLIATVKASPVHGGVLRRSNARTVARMRGVRRVIPVPNGLAVVAESFWRAKQALDALEPEFDAGEAEHRDDDWLLAQHHQALQRADGAVAINNGEALSVLSNSHDVHEATYFGPFLAHACMEPMSCTARVTHDQVDVWLGTQGIEYVTNEVARVTGRPANKVHVHNLMLGGGFGRRYEADYAIQAAVIAKEMPGTPVKVIWTREEDIQQDFYRPSAMAMLRAKLAPSGLPQALLVRASSPSIAAHNPGFAQFAQPVDISAAEGWSSLSYDIPNLRFEWVQTETHVRVGWWRSVGNSHNAFFRECFIDELAEKAGMDPLTYRLRMLSGDAHANTRNLLEALARAAHWGRPSRGCVQGLALHETYGTMVGQVVECAVSGQEVALRRVTCAYDCGRIVNPLPVDAQLRGGIIWGLTAALMGEITIENGRVRQSNFHDYPLLSLAQTPEMVLVPVLSGRAPTGVGEPGVPPVAPALANALYRATGQRLRRLPLSRAGFTVTARRD
jgi:isoquinoline 1-oxidoreductase beta subunit